MLEPEKICWAYKGMFVMDMQNPVKLWTDNLPDLALIVLEITGMTCVKYHIAEERKQRLKWLCYVRLLSGHRAF